MSSRIATYSCNSLPGVNSVSKMKPDDKGYWKCILGGFNIENESGIFYPLTDTVRTLFEKTGVVQRRIEKGMMFSEYGHPQLFNMSHSDCLRRLALIEPTRTCAHIGKIWLEHTKDAHGKDIVLVYGMVKPSGAYGDALEKSLGNTEENVAFSVRSFCQTTMYRGKIAKLVTDVLTYDYVTEPGIRHANQFNTVGLEGLVLEGHQPDIAFTEQDFNLPQDEVITMESSLVENIRMVRDSQGWHKVGIATGVTSTDW